MSSLVSVNLARMIDGGWKADVKRTGIDKRPVSGPVRLVDDHVEGDTVCDTRHHGGYDQAVYTYSCEDAAWWAAELEREVGPGAFGENLTTEGVAVTDAVIGERWAVGTAVLEVSCPRIPCRTLAGFWDVADMVRRFTVAARPGAYLRIIRPGYVQAGQEVAVVQRPDHGVTIGETFRALTGDRSLAHRLVEAPQLPAEAQQRGRRWMADAARTS